MMVIRNGKVWRKVSKAPNEIGYKTFDLNKREAQNLARKWKKVGFNTRLIKAKNPYQSKTYNKYNVITRKPKNKR